MTIKGTMSHTFESIPLDIDYEISDVHRGDICIGKDFEIIRIRVEGSHIDICDLLTLEKIREIEKSITCE